MRQVFPIQLAVFLLLSGCLLMCLPGSVTAQEHEGHRHHQQALSPADAQPFLAQALRISEALSFAGSALPAEVSKKLTLLKDRPHGKSTIDAIQQLLDPYCIAEVEINPESRVKVTPGQAKATLMQEGWVTYLVKVYNQAGITAKLEAESPNAGVLLHRSVSDKGHRMKPEHRISPGELQQRFIELTMYTGRPLKPALSGLGIEYCVMQLYTRETGRKEVNLGFHVGQGTQDIGFRNTIDILFAIRPAVRVTLGVRNEDGSPTTAAFVFTDNVERFLSSGDSTYFPPDYRQTLARSRPWEQARAKDEPRLSSENKLIGIYPLPSRRLAARDEYPDFFFQPQVYRADGEHVFLPPGRYRVDFSRGPEYQSDTRVIDVPTGVDSIKIDFTLRRWMHMAELGWYSGDHHIHAAGCSHYESPEEGVRPLDMFRQIVGEDLNMGSNLTWGPSWYHQKNYFTGKDHPLSEKHNLLRYDVEVSGFPSSHAGHLVLLNLREDDYPNTQTVEQWPTWTLPILKWAKSQGGVTGYAHSGWGLAPVTPTNKIPNYVLPKMDGIGANEYVVTVTHDVIDFYSLGDTPLPAELNMWYHTLNCGFRVRASGETDFPCITDERVGQARIYAKLDTLRFDTFMDAVKTGRTYVTDGYSHLIDFNVNGIESGISNSELRTGSNSKLKVSVRAAAYLDPEQNETGAVIAARDLYKPPYWHIERARIGKTRNVQVELIVNGEAVEKREMPADGNWKNVSFEYVVHESCWIAMRIFGSSHTNPVFVIVDDKPVRNQKSVDWCRAAVEQCWKSKHTRFREDELDAAKQGYDHARKVYDAMIRKRPSAGAAVLRQND